MNIKYIKGIALLLALGLSNTTSAATLSATDTGWYNNNGYHQSSNTNYIVGQHSNSQYRNWFTFDLSGTSNVFSATLRIFMLSNNGYFSPDSTETYNLWDVATNTTNLVSGTGGVAAYNDLGAGSLFGTHNISASEQGTFVEIDLNTNALASLTNAASDWAIGGSLQSTQSLYGYEYAFGSSHQNPQVELVINEATNVPEPSILYLLSLAGIGLSLMRKKKA